jgi:ribonuclease-3 family protein
MDKGNKSMEHESISEEYSQYVRKIEDDIMSDVKPSDIQMYNPAILAYIGDSVYELFVRTLLVSKGSVQVSKLHKKAILFVKAKAQAEMVDKLENYLTDEEKDIVRRGRNAKTHSMPKNADLADYKHATGFEALLGYLYLNNRMDRLMEILHLIIEISGENE